MGDALMGRLWGGEDVGFLCGVVREGGRRVKRCASYVLAVSYTRPAGSWYAYLSVLYLPRLFFCVLLNPHYLFLCNLFSISLHDHITKYPFSLLCMYVCMLFCTVFPPVTGDIPVFVRSQSYPCISDMIVLQKKRQNVRSFWYIHSQTPNPFIFVDRVFAQMA